jgi:hypothetical protein
MRRSIAATVIMTSGKMRSQSLKGWFEVFSRVTLS